MHPATEPIPAPLSLPALDVLVDGCESNPAFVRARLANALRDAQELLRRPLEADADAQAGNAAVALIADHVKTADPRAAVIEAAEQGLWLGMALAYRFTQNPEQSTGHDPSEGFANIGNVSGRRSARSHRLRRCSLR